LIEVIMKKVEIGPATLYCGDNREVFPLVGRVGLAATDPPYGIGADASAHAAGGKSGWVDYGATNWDRERPQRETFDAIRACSDHQVIWGANYFTDFLPPSMQWLVWDKGQRDFSLADFELAWTSQTNKAARMKTYPRSKALADGKVHPTQKPVEIMKWCIELMPHAEVVFDPFAGSFTTGVAAIQLGRRFIGVEQNETYFEHGVRRLTDAVGQGQGLFSL
jgi:site-specific DNA-methyltransferase (adenine-specific)